MNRTAERVLSIIAVILTGIGTILGFLGIAFFNLIKNDPTVRQEIEMEMMTDPTLSPADVEMVFDMFNVFGGFLWVIIIVMILSIVLNIVGIVNIWNNKNAKLAGIMFIVAGILGGILTLPSILLYIAAILCFTKKPPLQDDLQFAEQPYNDDTMRPL
ncbi:DUF4064 domain-containing protein [Sporosarcina oncorhynchi]|uniref:DUF4064 domain-containing protein n=1 Tax=Sporosarcina oncorhynchi TaxID=3056444 RepID=A0ABZ0L4L4_9BACL|nr:DUF4064 domain-containing protein [Sporosarcina sp. T2O-4]WOV87119.1 DUF4064 domain-containing protein [Sporosarcina sp. T2O-4]